MEKSLYTFTTNFNSKTNIFQVEARSHPDALQKWIEEILVKPHFQNISKQFLSDKVENIYYEEIGKNVWSFEIPFGDDVIYVHFVLTSQKEEPFYDTETAPKFIYDRLEDIDKQTITTEDIEFMLKLAFDFLEESGAVESLKIGSKTYCCHHLDDDDEIEKTKYIQISALRTGKNYSTDLIDQILDLEYEYMENIGLFEENHKVKYFGIEFNKSPDN